MNLRAEECRPSVGTEAAEQNSGDDFKLGSSIPRPADILARARRVDYALLVVSQRADGRVCSQFYSSLPAAERKVRRVHERGLPASLTLVRVTAVHSSVDLLRLLDGDSL